MWKGIRIECTFKIKYIFVQEEGKKKKWGAEEDEGEEEEEEEVKVTGEYGEVEEEWGVGAGGGEESGYNSSKKHIVAFFKFNRKAKCEAYI